MIDREALVSELNFKAVRSSGSGGQNVNKVATKVELSFNVPESLVLREEEKERLLKKLSHRLTKDHNLILQSGETRSQLKNKDLVIKRFLEIIKQGLKVKKKRIPTKISRAAIKKRLKEKRKLSDKKANRKKPDLE